MYTKIITLVLIAFLLGACAGSGVNRFSGRQTKPESRVPIENGGPHAAYWQTRDLTLNFDYQWEADAFDIKGSVQLSKMIAHFTTIDHLRIRIHFLDNEGVILATYNVWNAGNRVSLHYHFVNFNFDKQYAPPAGTQIIGFSYSGEASDTGGDGFARRAGGRGEWSFWWQP